MVSFNDSSLETIRQRVRPAENGLPLDELVGWIGDSRLVLIGEASHGTHEFYRLRAELTQRLVADKHFNAVVVEADWPDAWRVNRYVRGFKDDPSATEALGNFRRFPQWLWRNADVVDFVNWLRRFNDELRLTRFRCGFYGMDLYSLYASIHAVLSYLDKVDHAAATRARYRYACFEQFHEDAQAYGYAASFDLEKSCEDQAVQQLIEVRQKAAEYAQRDGRVAEDELFYAEQNARLIRNAEQYYRAMFQGRVSSWNLRDRHMAQTLEALVDYLESHVGPTKVVVWAHNSHLGDARATEMGDSGEVNVGQLAREKWGDQVYLVGFSTFEGTVTAASDWDGPAERKRVRPGLENSFERVFHEVGRPGFVLNLRGADAALREALWRERLQRAIGVIYRPESERLSHYFHTRLMDQFDAMIHVDRTRALEPLERTALWHAGEAPETYPSGV